MSESPRFEALTLRRVASIRRRSTYSDDALNESRSLAGLKSSRSDVPSAICNPAATASATGLILRISTESSEKSSGAAATAPGVSSSDAPPRSTGK